jgi:hypothetical protein
VRRAGHERVSIVALGLVTFFIGACGDLKTATPETDAGGSSSSGGNTSSSSGSGSSSGTASSSGTTSSSSGTTSGPTGPGPHGALPGGFCCTRDEDCRNRHCVDTAGGKMCLDGCRGNNDPCTRTDVQFTCDSAQFQDGWCQPPTGFVCKPSESFQRGTKKAGACCTPTGNGTAGLECEGGLCIAIGPVTNPYVCSNSCTVPGDCEGPMICQTITATKRECIPANSTYTCN